MFDVHETIDVFQRGAFELDCKTMVLRQPMEGGECFEGPGYVRQSDDEKLIFKIYVTRHNAKPFGHLKAAFGGSAGRLPGEETLYELDAEGHNGTRWTASRIQIAPRWNASDMSVLVHGEMESITAQLDMPQPKNYLRLHFFEEFKVPLNRMSEYEKHGNRHITLDRAEFEACGSQFEVRVQESSSDTIVEATSANHFPNNFSLRTQEALQFITGKNAFWRARLESRGEKLLLELASPQRKSARTQLSPPILPISMYHHKDGWLLFEKYLTYVVEKTEGTHWNPVAYHLYNACEATANSVDAWAVGISVAVEAVVGLVAIEADIKATEQLASFQKRAREWFAEQKDLSEISERVLGQINAMGSKRPQDTLHALALIGHVEKDYVSAWTRLRNRHVHPKLKDLQKPSPADYQTLFDMIRRAEVLLRQVIFHLIGYDGPFTDYGVSGEQAFVTKQYPLAIHVSTEQ